MSFDASIAVWAINIARNTCLIFQFIIVLDAGITYWVMNTTC